MVERDHKVVKPSILCDIPLVRGDCVDIPLVRSNSGGCVGIPLSEEVIVELWLCALSLKCEVDICLAKCHPYKCKGD